MITIDRSNMGLREEIIETIFEGLEGKVNLVNIIPSINIENVLILRNTPCSSELSSCFSHQLAHFISKVFEVKEVRLMISLELL